MTTAAELAHEPVRPLTRRQREMYRFGFALFLFTEGMLFLTLFATRFVLAGSGHPGTLDQVSALTLTGLMWLSILPARDAWHAAARGETGRLVSSLLLTALLGALMLVGEAVEWSRLELSSQSRFGGVFFTALGIHAVHMLGGMLALVGVAVSAARGRVSPGRRFPVEATVLFWLFLVGGWVVLYAVFYLL